MTDDLFDDRDSRQAGLERMGDGAFLLRGRAIPSEDELLRDVANVLAEAPFRHMITPGGFTMSVAMTNCGEAGWVTDRTGYRYDRFDPEGGRPWPAMPASLRAVAVKASAEARYPDFVPDACLLNRYEPGARLSLHQDTNPIVSVSLGLAAIFEFGGPRRADPVKKYPLRHGDVAVWGGPSRLCFHGVAALKEGDHALLGATRINLTFRGAL
jgi:DNA oxidative demethylase